MAALAAACATAAGAEQIASQTATPVEVVRPNTDGASAAPKRYPGLPGGSQEFAYKGDDSVTGAKFKYAVHWYATAAEIAPRDPVIHEMLGVALCATDSQQLAIPIFKHAVTLAENDLIASMLLQSALSSSGDANGAQALFQEMHRRFAPPPGMGRSEGALDASESIDRLTQRIKVEPGSAILYLLLGDAYQLSHQWEHADSAYRTSMRLAPEWSKPIINRGLSWMAQGNNVQAINVFNQALQVDPNNVAARIWLGDAQLHDGRSMAAVKTLRQLVSDDESAEPQVRGQAAISLGQAYSNMKEYPRAIASLEVARHLAPTDPTAPAVLGDVQLQAGNYEAATVAYQSALHLLEGTNQGEERSVLFRALAEAQISAHRLDEALETLNKALASNGENAALWHRLIAQVKFAQGDESAGTDELTAALDAETSRYPFDTLNALSARNLIPAIQRRYENRLADASGLPQVPGAGANVAAGLATNDRISIRIHSNQNPTTAAEEATDEQARALAVLASIAHYQNKTTEEISYRLRVTSLRSSATDWYMLAEAYDERARTPIPAREAYGRALSLKNGLSDAQIDQATRRLNTLTSAVYKP